MAPWPCCQYLSASHILNDTIDFRAKFGAICSRDQNCWSYAAQDDWFTDDFLLRERRLWTPVLTASWGSFPHFHLHSAVWCCMWEETWQTKAGLLRLETPPLRDFMQTTTYLESKRDNSRLVVWSRRGSPYSLRRELLEQSENHWTPMWGQVCEWESEKGNQSSYLMWEENGGCWGQITIPKQYVADGYRLSTFRERHALCNSERTILYSFGRSKTKAYKPTLKMGWFEWEQTQ